MRHATPETLATLAGFIAELRDVDGLIEKRPGAFSRGSRAFLHFHDDPTGIDADVRVTDDFERFRCTTARGQRSLLTQIRRAVAR
ncbi:MAG TPA: hypothetical protein VH914_01385 [Acidimicrobiia bacterium]|nr:hypothetical protein [Acidimicrobiia bacterium]